MDKTYFENHKKYNKVLWKFLVGCDNEDKLSEKIPDSFTPELNVSGAPFLDWVVQEILHSSDGEHVFEIITSRRKDHSKMMVRDWYDVNKPKGYTIIINIEGKAHPEVLYNACVSFILRTK